MILKEQPVELCLGVHEQFSCLNKSIQAHKSQQHESHVKHVSANLMSQYLTWAVHRGLTMQRGFSNFCPLENYWGENHSTYKPLESEKIWQNNVACTGYGLGQKRLLFVK